LVLILAVIYQTQATVLTNYELTYGNSVYQRFGAYTKQDSPFGGSQDAFIDYHLSFLVNEDLPNLTEFLGEVVVFYYSDQDSIGYGGSVIEKRLYCCTTELKNQGHCSIPNRLIISNDAPKSEIFYKYLEFLNYNKTTHTGVLKENFPLQKTGVWYILIANCNLDRKTSLYITGNFIWKNPFGYLPGQILGFLPLYWIMSAIYLLLLGFWIRLTFKYRKDIMYLQHGIGVVITISAFENLIWACDYTNYNFSGEISDAINIIGALFTSSKLTVIRTLMLVVAIGYTITRPILTVRYRIALGVLSIIYFILEATNQYIDVSRTAGLPVNDLFQYIALSLLLLINGVIFGWCGYELYFTFVKLEQNEGEKFNMYKRLGILLLISLILSVVILITQLVITALNQADLHFRVWWLWEGYWEFIYAACILYISWV